jgi:hypothetical protein
MNTRDSDASAGSCLNCGTALVGAYCHQCGQEADTGRITWSTLLRDHYRALGRLDSEILRTALVLTKDPGGFCRQYLEGRRRGRTAPVSYFFVSFFASFLLLAADRWLFRDGRAEAGATGPLEMQLVVLATAFTWALAHRIVFRKAGFTLPEHAVCMLYMYGQLNIFSAVLVVATAPLVARWPAVKFAFGVVAPALAFLYFVYFGSRLYRKSISRTLVRTLVVTALFLAIFVPGGFVWALVRAAWAGT